VVLHPFDIFAFVQNVRFSLCRVVPLLAGDAQGARGATRGPNSIAYARPGTLPRR